MFLSNSGSCICLYTCCIYIVRLMSVYVCIYVYWFTQKGFICNKDKIGKDVREMKVYFFCFCYFSMRKDEYRMYVVALSGIRSNQIYKLNQRLYHVDNFTRIYLKSDFRLSLRTLSAISRILDLWERKDPVGSSDEVASGYIG